MLNPVISKNNSGGHTLLEVMIAAVVLSSILIPIYVLFQQYLGRSSSTDQVVNHQLARGLMENILINKRIEDFDTLMQVGPVTYSLSVTILKESNLAKIKVTSKKAADHSKPIILERYVYLTEKN
jgi:Tfp pilus assembly protein PilV